LGCFFKAIETNTIRLCGKRSKLETEVLERLCNRIERRLTLLLKGQWKNSEATRLIKRLRRHRDELLTFLYDDKVPFENNHAERIIRDGVIKRKNSYGNRSKNGTETQAILMSIFQILKQRKLNHVNSFVNAVKEYLKTKKLPNLQKK
jgi:predicted CopG family antitoxin